MYKYEEDLVLRDLKPEQSGQYYCKTSSSAGSIKSSPATLTVIGMFRLGSHIKKAIVSQHHHHINPDV